MYITIAEAFLQNIRSLRLYVDSVEQILKEKKSESEEDKTALFFSKIRDFKKAGLAVESLKDGKVSLPNEVYELINDAYNLVEVKESDGETAASFSKIPPEIRKRVYVLESIDDQDKILYSGALMILITYFDSLFAQICKEDFKKHPERISLESKTIPYKLLIELKDLKDAKNHIIDEEVTKLMYQSVSDRLDYLKKNLKLDLQFINSINDNLTEVICRRNLYTHNNGIVNSIYLNLVAKKYIKPKGTKLKITRNYINDAIDMIEETGIALLLEVWLKECTDEESIGEIFDIVFDNFYVANRWEFSIACYDILLKQKNINNKMLMFSKLNRWVCFKQLGKYDEIKDEIIKIDVSAYSYNYQLGLLAIQDKIEEFFELYDKQSEIVAVHIENWPIFSNIRETSEFKSRTPENIDDIII